VTAPGSVPGVDDIIAANAADDVFLSDKGNAARFAELLGDVVRYCPELDTWYVWVGTHWEPDPHRVRVFALTAEVIRALRAHALALPDEVAGGGPGAVSPRERVLRWATATESEKARRRILTTAPEHPRLLVNPDQLDGGADELATPAGVVDLLSGAVRDGRPEDLVTRITSVGYDEDARSPLLDRYLDTFVPEPDDQEVLFAVLGTALRGGNPGRLLPILLGATTSGKSQLVAALARLLGRYVCTINASVFRGNLDDKPRPDLVRAMDHRVAYAVEASKVWELHADQIKRITGGDAVPYRNLYSQSEERVPRFTPLIVTNEMPRIKGADDALRRRLVVVTFSRTLPPELEDTRVKEAFVRDEGCLRALLARIVRGAGSPLLRDGVKWSLMPERYAQATASSFDELDHVGEFLEWLRDRGILEVVDMTETPASKCAQASELHEWYGAWVRKHGDRQDRQEALSMKDLGRALRQRGWESRLSGGTRWLGVRLATPVGPWAGMGL